MRFDAFDALRCVSMRFDVFRCASTCFDALRRVSMRFDVFRCASTALDRTSTSIARGPASIAHRSRRFA
jgi:hypothetical protein